MEYDIMCKFPLMTASEDLKKWTGFLSLAQGQTNLLSLAVPSFPDAKGVYVEVPDLEERALGYWSKIIEDISGEEYISFMEYLDLIDEQVQARCANKTDASDGKSHTTNPMLYSTVIEDIEIVGVKNITSLSRDFKEMTITHCDDSNRKHQLKLIIPDGYPNTKVRVMTELPLPTDSIVWPMRIHEVNQMYMSYLEKCCKFWDDMDDLDSRIRVVEPVLPNRSHFHRRVLLANNVIVHVIFNALKSRSLPEISFSGPEKQVESFSAAIDNECSSWDDNLPFIQNLKMILDCQFLSQEEEEEQNQEEMLCTVCYVYSFETEIPEINCDCGAIFHRQCLHDLFVSNVSKSGLRRCVDCPNCEMEIRVPAGFAVSTW